MQTYFSRFSYSPRIFWFRDILSENQSLVHAQWRDNVPLTLSQDYNLLLIFSTPMLMESCTKQVVLENASYSKNQWLPTSRLMMITPLPSLHTINKKSLFTVLSYFKHLKTLDNPAMWYHVIRFPVITQSQRQNVDCFSPRAVSWNSQ